MYCNGQLPSIQHWSLITGATELKITKIILVLVTWVLSEMGASDIRGAFLGSFYQGVLLFGV